MNRIQLAQLRDIAIEYLPEAQKASDNFKQWAKVKRLGSRDYALRLYQAASCSLGDASLPAVEIAAANLMQALALWETYDPNDVPQDDLTPDEIRKYCMEKIKETANTLAEVTGRDVTHLIPADTPAAKGKAVPVTSLSGDDKPWLIEHPDDPAPDYPWYPPARYFARQLVKDDSTLLVKKGKLAEKTAASLAKVGIKKRGNKLPLAGTTVEKAFVNVKLI